MIYHISQHLESEGGISSPIKTALKQTPSVILILRYTSMATLPLKILILTLYRAPELLFTDSGYSNQVSLADFLVSRLVQTPH